MWAEFILAVLFIVLGLACGLSAVVVLWAGALERAATGYVQGANGAWATVLALIAVAGIGGGLLILI